MSKPKILFALSGSIAAFKATQCISNLVKNGFEVQCVGTKNSLQFMGPATLEGLTGKPYLTDIFQSDHMMDHIHLARWADLLVVAPASASTLAKMNLGLADDLVSTLYLALSPTVPVLVAPAMNPQMWAHPKTQDHIQSLTKAGVRVLSPSHGPTACGEVGLGRMIEAPDLERAINSALGKVKKSGRILVTSGGTSESIDSVRKITNSSTGRTGASLADELYQMGYEVDLLCAEQSIRPKSPHINTSTFVSYGQIKESLRHLLGTHHYDGIVHAAAISDYSVDGLYVDGEKIDPDKLKVPSGKQVKLHLKPNEKLIYFLREWSKNKSVKLVGFKLTNTKSEEERQTKIETLFQNAQTDLVVHNDLSDISGSFHHYSLYINPQESFKVENATELARKLGEFL